MSLPDFESTIEELFGNWEPRPERIADFERSARVRLYQGGGIPRGHALICPRCLDFQMCHSEESHIWICTDPPCRHVIPDSEVDAVRTLYVIAV